MLPSFFMAAKALSTTLRSSPVSSATLPAFRGSPASLGVRGLPVCIIQCRKQSALISGMIGFNRFVNVIERILEQDEKA